ncbi:primosomal protein N' [Acholeplasma vituli]|uniref:Replication restart protein PriA n=1 Tax=Paracholeplasma vituli TaxID=69473 RepID=A0ABT2PV26_9MOLU|nr:primosomal protein N' [Paracholeplasma vituli]MCU0104568.1 primosomal protein N' [Paracholeplasma vituli]
MFAEVMVDLKTKEIQSSYDYIIPSDLEGFLKLGMRVVVPFGNMTRVGLITKIKSESLAATKAIIEPFDMEPIVDKELFHLINYLEEEAMIPSVLAYHKVIPDALSVEYQKVIRVMKRDGLKEPLKSLLIDDVVVFKKTWRKYSSAFQKAVSSGSIEIDEAIDQKRSIQTENYYLKTTKVPQTQKQQALWLYLNEPKRIEDILDSGYSKQMVQTLVKMGSISIQKQEKMVVFKPTYAEDSKALTREQKEAVLAIKESLLKYERFLLKGVSASGKTEVFLQLCMELSKKRKQAMIITLDTALIEQLRLYLNPFLSVAVIDPEDTLQSRLDSYRAAQTGYVDVLITTPSGIFTPFKSLGIIIADEAQDPSYIDYAKTIHGLDMLQERARYNNIPLVYASATPPVQLYYDATLGKLRLIELNEKVYQTKDQLQIVDMKKELENGNLSMLSKPLYDAINRSLKDNKQALILANRNGFAPYVLCRSCGHVPTCERCDTTLTYFENKRRLKCPHCGYQMKYEPKCMACGSDKVRPVGMGIEQVEVQMKRTFPLAKIARLDSETTSKKGVYQATINAFKAKKIDILIGTQMISKGHDFDIPVVGILLIDSMLKAPSYLANERCYQLIKQTMGRAGRKQAGVSIVQTYQTDHFVLKSLEDEIGFYEQELNRRQIAHYPPYYQLLSIVFKGNSLDQAERAATKLKQQIISRYSQYEVVGPSESDIKTFKLMIKTGKRQDLKHWIQSIKQYYDKENLSVRFYRYDDIV